MQGRFAALSVLVLVVGLSGGILIEKFVFSRDVGGEDGPKILYWVAPMDPNFRKDGPGKSPMGMDLIPVYEGQEATGDPEELTLDPREINAIGVRTATARLEPIANTLETVGFVTFNDYATSHIHTRVEGWIEQLKVRAVGDRVRKGDLLFVLYAPEISIASSELRRGYQRNDQREIATSKRKLKNFGVADRQIEEIARSKKTVQHIKVYAPQDGVVIEMGEAEYMVRATGYVDEISDLVEIPLLVNERGASLILGDVAEIRLGPEMRRGVGELNGEGDAVGGVVIMRWGGNALSTIKAVKAKLEELRPSLPEGVLIVTTYDRSGVIERAIDNLQSKLTEEFIVVVLVCGAFLLHSRSSLVIVLSLPLGIFAASLIMKIQGVNANIMSLGGIAIAIGAMVDAAIVMIEALHRRIEKEPLTNENRWRIVSEPTREVGPALFYSLAIITVSFLPVFVLESQEGRLFKPLAFTKTYAMAAAAMLSITLVPVLMGYFVRGRILPERKNPLNQLCIFLYRPFMDAAVAWPWLTISLAGLLVVSMFHPLGSGLID